ncbi:hypothetical protein PPGU19_100990 (plasmid) [Paraburkholderia sp. PGU19]|uniref:hypothetical protein n=1 Tax=Paraburkholderia sp. PGU19 TaxID=2735434 RepID=UPI0015DA75CA|nr:hypothetical protein [Paraburkholderia sp. PGU19]BCG05531.1 hypothetical protein PPGU19_100990 [Paraburkholderia sp. PGU19]
MKSDEILGLLLEFDASLERLRTELPPLIADLDHELEVNAALNVAVRNRALDVVRNRRVPASLADKIATDGQDDQAYEGSTAVFSLRKMLDWMDEPRPAIEGDGANALDYRSILVRYVTVQRNRAIDALAALRERSKWLADVFARFSP